MKDIFIDLLLKNNMRYLDLRPFSDLPNSYVNDVVRTVEVRKMSKPERETKRLISWTLLSLDKEE